MPDQVRRSVLLVIGLVFIIADWPMMVFWPSAWQWQPGQPEYEQMIIGLYATLGVYLVIASRNPARHISLIGFAAWSSLVHTGIMAIQAIRDTAERGHFIGDIPALGVMGILLLAALPKRAVTESAN